MNLCVDALVAVRNVAKLYPHLSNITRYRKYNTSSGTVEEGDIVILRRADRVDDRPTFTRPLKKGAAIETHYGTIKHDDLIGRIKNRDTITTTTGRRVRVHVPTLAEYVTLTPRIVTPVRYLVKEIRGRNQEAD